MNLVDSSAWLEYFADDPNADFFAAAIEDPARLLVSTVNVYEVFKVVYQRRGEGPALPAVAVVLQGQVRDVTRHLAIQAARLSAQRRLPMADSLIYQTARQNGATLWTQDSDFESLDQVRTNSR